MGSWVNLPNYSLDLRPMAKVGFDVFIYRWNQQYIRKQVVLSFLVSLMLNLNYTSQWLVLVWFTCILNIHSVNLAHLEKYQLVVFTQKSVSWSPMSLSIVSLALIMWVLLLSIPPYPCPRLLSTPFSCTWKQRGVRLFSPKAISPWAAVQIYYPHHLCSFGTLAKAWK